MPRARPPCEANANSSQRPQLDGDSLCPDSNRSVSVNHRHLIGCQLTCRGRVRRTRVVGALPDGQLAGLASFDLNVPGSLRDLFKPLKS
jgi:hypothetical protein